MDPNTDPAAPYLAPLQLLENVEKERAVAYNNLKRAYQHLLGQFAQKCEEHEQEHSSARLWAREYKTAARAVEMLENELSSIKATNNSSNSQFAFAILDGDGAIFREDLVARGKDGGEEAAHILHEEIKNYIRSVNPDAKVERIVVQIVLSLDQLNKTFHASGVLRNPDLHSFAQGFCRAQPLFSIVDVGPGKEQADHKVRKMFELMEADPQCKHLIFGGCHDNGYVPFLRPYSGSMTAASRITLLETAEPGSEFRSLNFPRTRFNNIFRTENIPSKPMLPIGNPILASRLPPATSSPVLTSPHLTRVSSPAQSAVSNPDHDGSWAAVGRNGSISKTIDLSPKKDNRPFIQLNQDEERIDRRLPPAEATAQRRVQENARANGANFCNRYHLNNACSNSADYCQFVHGERLSGADLNILKHMTRGIACPELGRCRDSSCPLGHHCKTPNNCSFGSKCRFAATHNMDQAVALKVYDDGSTEMAR